MSSVAVDLKRIENDLHSLMSIADNEVSTLRRHIDFQEIVGSVLDKHRYTYTLESGGDFSILAAPGMSIFGKWDGLSWSVSVNISYGSLSANTSYRDSKCNYYDTVKLCPASFHEYVPIFDSLIEKLRKYYADYEATTKSNKSSQLLKQLVRPLLRKLNITEAIFEPNDSDDGLLKFRRRICSNLYLSTTIDFDNYESRCEEMKLALDNLPSIKNDEFLKYIYFKNADVNWYGCTEEVIHPQLETGEGIKMCYDKANMKATSHYEYDPNIIACLDKLGFKYSVTPKSKKLKISLSDKISLFRKGFNSWFKNKSYIYSPTKAVELSTSEFISLLRIIAKTSMVEGKYPYVHIGREEEFIAGLKPILKYCIPGNCYALDYPWINIYFDKNAKDGFRWSRNRANWLSIFFYVIQNYEFIKGILHSLEQMEFPNVKIIIKNTGQ